VVDVSDPARLEEVGRLPLTLSANDVVATGDYAMVADRYGVTLVDVTNPAEPKWLDRFVPSDIDPDLLPRIISVDSADDVVYVAVDPSSIFVLGMEEGPLPTPSVPPTGIPTSTPEPTATPTVTSTTDPNATATPSSTPERESAFLPIAWRGAD
jgi:hypothetical protein